MLKLFSLLYENTMKYLTIFLELWHNKPFVIVSEYIKSCRWSLSLEDGRYFFLLIPGYQILNL